jgi:hypothetical protein
VHVFELCKRDKPKRLVQTFGRSHISCGRKQVIKITSAYVYAIIIIIIIIVIFIIITIIIIIIVVVVVVVVINCFYYPPLPTYIDYFLLLLYRLHSETLPLILRQLIYGQESLQKEAIYALGSIINLGLLTQEMFSNEVLRELESFLSLNVRDVGLYIQILTIIKQSILQNPALKSAFNTFNFEHVDNISVDPYTTDPTLLKLCDEVTEIMYAYMESLDGLDDNDDDDGAIEVSAVAFNGGGRGDGGVFSFGVGGNGSSSSSVSSSFKF